jgi:hypothetical protein
METYLRSFESQFSLIGRKKNGKLIENDKNSFFLQRDS